MIVWNQQLSVNHFIHIKKGINHCPAICDNLVAYLASNMDPDQTAPFGAVWSGFIVFASMVKLTIVACSIICLCTLVAYLTNNMDPDQVHLEQSDQGLMFASMVKVTIVACSIICLCILVAYLANNMDPDQTAPIRIHIVCFHGKNALECI